MKIRIQPESRFSRFSLVSWWDQERLQAARIVLVGAGALGNEVLKNLALLGAGQVAVIDMDDIEPSNLSRATLFREADVGRPKAMVAAEAFRSLYPGGRAYPLAVNVVHGAGLGLFRWADVVIGALDNREARLAVNRSCQRTRTPWIDGGIEVLSGLARVFHPGDGACYECTLSEADWKILEQRRACSLLPRDERPPEPRVPTTPTTAAVIAGIQCAEAVKILHDMEGLDGEGFQFDGRGYDCYRVRYQRNADCYAHEPLPEIRVLPLRTGSTTVAALLDGLASEMGTGVALESTRELVAAFHCATCSTTTDHAGALESVTGDVSLCLECHQPRAPVLYHRLDRSPCPQDATLAAIGIPPWDILIARAGGEALGIEFGADREPLLLPQGGLP